MAYLTKAIFKSDWMNIPSANTDTDALIDRMIAAVEREIDGICGQPMQAQSVVTTMNGTGSHVLPLWYTVPTALVSVEARDRPTLAWESVTGVAMMDIDDVAKVWGDERFTRAYYRVTATVGYTTPPDDVIVCGYELVKELYLSTPFAAQGDRFGVSALTEADSGINFAKTLLPMRARIAPKLSPYRLIRV